MDGAGGRTTGVSRGYTGGEVTATSAQSRCDGEASPREERCTGYPAAANVPRTTWGHSRMNCSAITTRTGPHVVNGTHARSVSPSRRSATMYPPACGRVDSWEAAAEETRAIAVRDQASSHSPLRFISETFRPSVAVPGPPAARALPETRTIRSAGGVKGARSFSPSCSGKPPGHFFAGAHACPQVGRSVRASFSRRDSLPVEPAWICLAPLDAEFPGQTPASQ
jgi:hypothetical protein